MVICHSCGQKVKAPLFRRGSCPACLKPWNSLVATVNPSHGAYGQTILPPGGQEFYDLGNLLSSIRVQEPAPQEIQVFSDVWAPRGYPTRSFFLSILLHIGLIGLLYGLS